MHDRRGVSGWLVGMVCAVLFGLWAFPPVRYTLSAQIQFALSANNVAWMRALDSRESLAERPHLDATAAANPDDYLLQVGRATVLIETVSPHEPSLSALTPASDDDDHTLFRLGRIARDFPLAPGAYAHLARYMTSDRLRVQDAQTLPPAAADARPNSILSPVETALARRARPAHGRDVRLMLWALRYGELRDPDNAFWPAMRAVTYFAALRDQEALREIGKASRKSHWDAYVYEEILGQWRLYAATYGDNGAAQKIAPLSLLAFPHLRELRRVAELARWISERYALEGKVQDALRIRREVGRLGILLREKAQWAYEALYGTDLFLIANTDSGANLTPANLAAANSWEQQATGYLELLRRTRRASELTWIRDQVEAGSALRKQVDVARFDAAFPGTPPGIPLVPLFGYWMAGVCILTQTLSLCVTAAVAEAWSRRETWERSYSNVLRVLAFGTLAALTLISGMALFMVTPTQQNALICLISATLLTTLGLNQIYYLRNDKPGVPRRWLYSFADQQEFVEQEWRWTTTLEMLFALLIPGAAILYLFLPTLSTLHPVAAMLTGLMGTGRDLTVINALIVGLLASALPIAITLYGCVWAFWRNLSPLACAVAALRRLAVPCLACLILGYIVLLSHTLRLDADASHAINEAAQNESKWVLTHSDSGLEE